MTTKEVLNRIITLLNRKEVELTYARLKDGTIVESPTFDLGEDVEVVSEDGTKSLAPDGEHELVLRDESGNENIIRVVTKDGKIVERENVEEKENEDMKAEDVEVKDIPQSDGVIGKEKEEKMAVEEELPSGDGVEETAEPLPGEEDSPYDFKSEIEKMAYRIDELEKKIAKMAEVEIEVKGPEEEEEELPKLDGAPVEEQRFSAPKAKSAIKDKISNPQHSFLSKLYNK